MEETRKRLPPPYLPYKTFRTFLSDLSQGVPGRIDRSLMPSMSGGMQSALMQTLRFLNLIEEDGTPTEDLSELSYAEGADREVVLRRILLGAYRFLVDGFDLKTATSHQFEEKFRENGVSGDTVRKATVFFMQAANDAGIELSRYITGRPSPSGRTQGNRSTPRQRSSLGRINGAKPEEPAEAPKQPGNSAHMPAQATWTQMLIAKFPTFDPSWDDEIKLKWFSAFDELMKRGREEQDRARNGP